MSDKPKDTSTHNDRRSEGVAKDAQKGNQGSENFSNREIFIGNDKASANEPLRASDTVKPPPKKT